MNMRSRRIAVTIAGAVLLATASVQAQTVSCRAEAGLTNKGANGTATSGHDQRAASYDVDLSSGKAGDRPTVTVSIHPHSPAAAAAADRPTARIDRILLRSPFKSEAIAQPATFAHGGSESEAIATFDAAAVRTLPEGDVNVILFTPDGERLCRIKKGDRETLTGRRR